MKKKIIIGSAALLFCAIAFLVIDEMRSDLGILDLPAFSTPTRRARKSCERYMIEAKMWGQFEIISSSATLNDPEVGNRSYPITGVVVIRMNGPLGWKKGIATFACDQNGNVMPIELPTYTQLMF